MNLADELPIDWVKVAQDRLAMIDDLKRELITAQQDVKTYRDQVEFWKQALLDERSKQVQA